MLVSPAYAQAAGAGGGDLFVSLMPLVLIFIVFYFLLIRPQQAKVKQHRNMIEALKKGDQVLTAGGIVGRVVRVDPDGMLLVDIAQGVQVKVARSTITDIVGKPATGNDNTPATTPGSAAAAPSGFLGKLFKR